ncbi:hypothetical protein N9112_00195 [bacterium]|nr:hypothetical protein [bacterium]
MNGLSAMEDARRSQDEVNEVLRKAGFLLEHIDAPVLMPLTERYKMAAGFFNEHACKFAIASIRATLVLKSIKEEDVDATGDELILEGVKRYFPEVMPEAVQFWLESTQVGIQEDFLDDVDYLKALKERFKRNVRVCEAIKELPFLLSEEISELIDASPSPSIIEKAMRGVMQGASVGA